MITNFHIFETNNTYKFIVDDVMSDLQVEIQYPEDSVVIPKSIYHIDVIDYFKEILLNKNISFLSVNKPENNPYVSGKVVNVDQLAYKDEFFITVKLNDKPSFKNSISDWILINNQTPVTVQNYDADDKPLHKKVKLEKMTNKYNL